MRVCVRHVVAGTPGPRSSVYVLLRTISAKRHQHGCKPGYQLMQCALRYGVASHSYIERRSIVKKKKRNRESIEALLYWLISMQQITLTCTNPQLHTNTTIVVRLTLKSTAIPITKQSLAVKTHRTRMHSRKSTVACSVFSVHAVARAHT